MARFNPENYPDRLAFHSHAKRIRAQEMDRLLGAARAWVATLFDEVVHGVARPVVRAGAGARRPLHH